jgi:copper homeostasis protein
MPRTLEICVTDTAGARAAEAGGADRLELCADLASGGITPSYGQIRQVVRSVEIPTHVLIRPRGGDFVHDPDEVGVMLDDLSAARDLGAAGIVLGVLRIDGTIDVGTIARLIDHARPLSVTFHRAFDLVSDPHDALEDLIRLRVDRVLTAGGPGPARENVAAMRSLVKQAAGRIAVIAGGSIADSDVPGLLEATGVEEIHVGSAVTVSASEAGPFGSRPAVVEAERVRTIVRLARSS